MMNLKNLFRKSKGSIPEGWDYTSRKKNGKNIYFFRDNGHPDMKIQQKIFDESLKMVDQKIFELIFSEGFEGMSKINYLNPVYANCKFDVESLKRKRISEKGYWQSAYMLGIQSMNNKIPFVIWGVDSEELIGLSGRYIKREGILNKKALTDSLSSTEIQESENISLIFDKLTSDRSIYSVNYLANKMDELKKSSAGLIFGEGHYKEMKKSLLERNIGVISYYPGESDKNISGLDYSLSFED